MKINAKTRIILIVLAAAIAIGGIIAACVLLIKPGGVPEGPPDSGLTKPEDYVNVTISGADDISVVQGTFFNCFSGVKATAQNGTDLSSHLNVSGEVNTSKVGDYILTYSIKDLYGNSIEKTRKVTVKANPAIGKVKPVPTYTVASGSDFNIAKNCEAIVTATTDGSAFKALDGDFKTRWESTHGVDNVNFTVNLGAPLKVNDVNIYWEAAYATDFSILVSTDGTSWKKVKEVTAQTLQMEVISGSETYANHFSFEDTTAQFVRLACEKRKTVFGYSIFELEVLGPTGTQIPKEEYPDLFDAEKSGSPDWKIADEQQLEFDLGSEKEVDTLRLAFKNYLTPATFRVLYAGADKDFKEIKINNLPYSADTFSFAALADESNQKLTLTARYFKVELKERTFYVPAYRVTEAEFRLGEAKIAATATASSSKSGHEARYLTDGKNETFWENANNNVYQTIDLTQSKPVGRVDLYWRGDDGGKGKYYDLQISLDGINWTTVFRQTHGATQKQSVYVYETARYLRVIDYQNTSTDRYDLEGIVVRSQYPQSSGEGKVNYDTSIAFPSQSIITTENGSYVTGITNFPSSRLIAYLDDSLRGKPVPSNDWWQGLLIADKGYNMYMNPLTATFKSDGLWLTNPGEGYFDGFVPGNGSQTVNVDVHDVAIGCSNMGKDAQVRVTGYSDYGISAVMSDDDNVDKLTVFLSEGTLYAYCIFAEPEKALLKADNLLGVYDLNGNEILTEIGANFTGDAIVLKVLTHSGYETGVKKYKKDGKEYTNAALYEERYYVVSVPENTRFVMGEGTVSAIMSQGNYMSVGAVAQKNTVKQDEKSNAKFPLSEVETLHKHGYAFVTDTSCLYGFNGETNTVTTEFRLKTVLMRSGFSAEAYSAYLPHQLAKSNYNNGNIYAGVRGDCRSFAGNLFTTRDTFYGLVPTFVEPNDSGYSSNTLYDQLLLVYANNGGDKAPEDSNLISSDPYWQGKNLHPMAMAAIAADQIGATDLREKFLDKIEYILTDWFTYDAEKDAATGAYFYYDGEWGTLYYKNSEFGAGVNLADHYFTYGYYTLASGVLAAYRPEFAQKWGDMVELLIRDYMNPKRNDNLFPYMRNFDPFAGHGWAGGYADNNGGNNQESAGEALNSWVGAYLYATAVGDEEVRTAAIYGFTTELAAIKHYWFDYFGDFPQSYPFGVAGQVYGGSNFYGTFFNGEPLYMYGIHLIPGEEFLTSYALNGSEREQLKGLLEKMRKEQANWDFDENNQSHKEIYAWQHIFIPITAIYDADEAIEWYEETLKKQGSVGNTSEQFNVYWLIHGMKSTGLRTTDIWAEDGASATVYKNGNDYVALCWNPTGADKKFTFRNKNGVTGFAVVPAKGLVSCNPLTETRKFESYKPLTDFKPENVSNSQNLTISGGQLSFGNNASATYLLTFGSENAYYNIKISGGAGVKLLIDGAEVPLTQTAQGYESGPVTLSFKHTVTLSGSNATVNGFAFEKLSLSKSNVKMTATASSQEAGDTGAANAVDGDMKTRWSSQFTDDQWLKIELAEPTLIYQMRIYWQTASAKEYKVYFSQTGEDNDWTEVFYGNYSGGERCDRVTPSQTIAAKFIKIEGVSRTTEYGYSIFEIELYNFNK